MCVLVCSLSLNNGNSLKHKDNASLKETNPSPSVLSIFRISVSRADWCQMLMNRCLNLTCTLKSIVLKYKGWVKGGGVKKINCVPASGLDWSNLFFMGGKLSNHHIIVWTGRNKWFCGFLGDRAQKIKINFQKFPLSKTHILHLYFPLTEGRQFPGWINIVTNWCFAVHKFQSQQLNFKYSLYYLGSSYCLLFLKPYLDLALTKYNCSLVKLDSWCLVQKKNIKCLQSQSHMD